MNLQLAERCMITYSARDKNPMKIIIINTHEFGG